MPAPRLASFPAIRAALKFYQVASIITGVMLILLLAEMVAKYALQRELFLGGNGFLWFAEVIVGPDCQWWSLFAPWTNTCSLESAGNSSGGMNLSLGILVAHGWFYVLYLFACFRVWSLMRWPFVRFLLLALGGVVPFLSFVLEVRTTREVRGSLASREAADADASTPAPATKGSR